MGACAVLCIDLSFRELSKLNRVFKRIEQRTTTPLKKQIFYDSLNIFDHHKQRRAGPSTAPQVVKQMQHFAEKECYVLLVKNCCIRLDRA